MGREVTVAALIPSVRPEMLRDMMDSWHLGNTEGMHIHILAQREEQQEFLRVLKNYPFREQGLLHFTYMEEGGPLWPRRAGYLGEHWDEADAWVVLDDDMILLEGLTDWMPAVQKSMEPGVGVISCNWARSEKLVPKKLPLVEGDKRWLKEHVINIGGGLVMSKEVARIIGSYHTDVPWMFDGTMYGLVPYLEGYQNYRDLGSLLIHKILAKGGMKEVRAKFPLVPLPEDLIYCPPSSEIYKGEVAVNNVNIPTSSNLTPKAREIHKSKRKARGWA